MTYGRYYFILTCWNLSVIACLNKLLCGSLITLTFLDLLKQVAQKSKIYLQQIAIDIYDLCLKYNIVSREENGLADKISKIYE